MYTHGRLEQMRERERAAADRAPNRSLLAGTVAENLREARCEIDQEPPGGQMLLFDK